MKISVLGLPYSYHHLAAISRFGREHDFIFRDMFDDLIADVKNGNAEYCLIAVENSVAGDVPGNIERVVKSGCRIFDEIRLRIRLSLGGKRGIKKEDIKTVYSHPMGLKETRNYFRNKMNIAFVETVSTATAAKIVSERDDTDSAAITSKAALQHFGLDMLENDISDNPENITRFLILDRKPLLYETTAGPVKASLLLHCENPKSLTRATEFIQVIYTQKISESEIYLEGEMNSVPDFDHVGRILKFPEARIIGIYHETTVLDEP